MICPAPLYILLLAIGCVFQVHCATKNSAVYSLVYNDIGSSSFDKCIRIMNGTKQIGCQSELNGNVGILFLVNTTPGIDKIIAGQDNPYIALIQSDIFDGSAVKTLQDSGKVNGIIVFASDGYVGKPSGWSPEPKCPRYIYGLYNDLYGPQFAKCETSPWNVVGDGLSYYDIGFPVFYMQNKTATEQLLRCYNEHNLDGSYPFCAVRMDARMDGAVSTETCIRRNNNQYNLSPSVYCEEMGGQNILGMLQPSTNASPVNKPIILVTAALDSRSFMLQSNVPGANSATGFITMLSVARLLGNLTQEQKESMTHRVVFVLFDGEAFDNTGSTRMVYDMTRNEFPFSQNREKQQPENVDLSKVEYIIEIGQVGHSTNLLWVHYDPISNQTANISEIVNLLQEQSSGQSVEFRKSSDDLGLPPSSLQSVLKEQDTPGVLITDFDKNYANKYYLSAYDTPDKLRVEYNENMTESETVLKLQPLAKRINEIANVVSKTVYQLGSGKNLTDLNSDTSDIANTLYCYLFNGSCTFFWLHADASVSQSKGVQAVMSRYVSVYRSSELRIAAYFARNLLLWYTGERVDVNASNACKAPENDDRYLYLVFNRNSTVCIRAPVYATDGRSPASVISNYNYAEGKYPAWSESQWNGNAFRLTLFTVQDPTSQGMVLMTGLLFFFFAISFVMFVKRKSETLFDPVDVL